SSLPLFLYWSGIEKPPSLNFDCKFSFTVWTCIAARCSIQLAHEWTRTINHMQATLGELSVRSLITSEDLKTPTQQLCPG
ncbi:unnamed protein product, partial [Brassica rapa subsp. trilocularis]